MDRDRRIRIVGGGRQSPRLLLDSRRIATHQHSGIGVLGVAIDLAHRPLLPDDAILHDDDVVAEARHHAQVVTDEDHRAADFALELMQQLDNLHLEGGIKRRGGLVGDQQVGPHHHRHGDGHALALPARKLVRVHRDAAFGLGHADVLEHLDRPHPFLCHTRLVAELDVGHVLADGQGRRQRPQRILRDVGYARPAQIAHGTLGQAEQVVAVEDDPALGDLRRVGQQAQYGARQGRLAAAALADDAGDATTADVEAHVVERLHRTVAERQVLDRDKAVGGHA